MATETFQLDTQNITFEWQYSQRKTLGITITPEMELKVTAPTDTPIEKIKESLSRRSAWIRKQMRFFSAFYPKTPEKQFVSGESHLYLGRQYRLQITTDYPQEKENQVEIESQFLKIYCQDKSLAKKLITQWYQQQAQEMLHALAKPLFERFVAKHKLSETSYQVVIQKMQTRWGSCTQKGKILLNPELIKAPQGCIQYVIIHELCHLIHHNHSTKFLTLQKNEMPDWEKWKHKLETLLN